MSAPILATKLYIPQSRQKVVVRPRLSEQLNEVLRRKLTLISAPAGFGKTTLLSEWCNLQSAPIAWLSLDEGDSAPARFLAYLVAALQTLAPSKAEGIAPQIGEGVLAVLQAPQPPPPEAILTVLVNEIAAIPDHFILVLDDYHLMDGAQIDQALTFLVEHLPPQMHLVIATRQDPQLPLSQLRARAQLTELRAADLRFTFAEAAEFLNRVMGLNLSAQNIAALEMRTEGWVAGLQLAALAMSSNRTMHGQTDTASFIQSFTGSHRFVLDYLLEQVLQQQSEDIQSFLLCTSILDRLCGPSCDAVLRSPAGTGKETLAYLERANLFLFPLDNERHWYRYHRLFADLLRQRLQQKFAPSIAEEGGGVAEFHQHASAWYEKNDLMFEAFQHAAAANDVERAERLLESGRMPFHFPGAVRTILDWLSTLPQATLDAHPVLGVRSGSLLLVIGITTGVEEKLDAAENALQGLEWTDKTRNLVGEIASARATLALTRYQIDTILAQSQRALEYLRPDNFAFRTYAFWAQGIAYFFQGNRVAARRALTEALALAQASGSNFSMLLATTGLGAIQEVENELSAAVETYRRALQLAGEPALSIGYDAHLGLARIFYEWNDLDTAQYHGEQSLVLARQYDRVIDRHIVCQVFLAHLKLAQGDTAGASAILARAEQDAREHNFVLRMPELAAAQVPVLLYQGNIAAAAQLARTYNLPMSQARVHLAQGDASAALAALEPLREFVQAKHWADEQLKVMVLQAIALYSNNERDKSVELLGNTLALADPSGFIRLFVDEGEPMRVLLLDFSLRAQEPSRVQDYKLKDYVEKILAAFARSSDISQSLANDAGKIRAPESAMIEPLSERELEILKLIAQGYSNQEISERLFLAL
ncbi:MAG: LuxR family transcriptional regulator, partial [Chloroflexi bacterium]|nr:LuxR family transcriptional regulator [Chloroflexota bacterium]